MMNSLKLKLNRPTTSVKIANISGNELNRDRKFGIQIFVKRSCVIVNTK